MDDWQIVASVAASVVIPVGLLLWRVYNKLDEKLDRQSASHNQLAREVSQLAREFSELRGEIRARFGILDQERLNQALEGIRRASKGRR